MAPSSVPLCGGGRNMNPESIWGSLLYLGSRLRTSIYKILSNDYYFPWWSHSFWRIFPVHIGTTKSWMLALRTNRIFPLERMHGILYYNVGDNRDEKFHLRNSKDWTQTLIHLFIMGALTGLNTCFAERSKNEFNRCRYYRAVVAHRKK